jgi:hypothetical protein
MLRMPRPATAPSKKLSATGWQLNWSFNSRRDSDAQRPGPIQLSRGQIDLPPARPPRFSRVTKTHSRNRRDATGTSLPQPSLGAVPIMVIVIITTQHVTPGVTKPPPMSVLFRVAPGWYYYS